MEYFVVNKIKYIMFSSIFFLICSVFSSEEIFIKDQNILVKMSKMINKNKTLKQNEIIIVNCLKEENKGKFSNKEWIKNSLNNKQKHIDSLKLFLKTAIDNSDRIIGSLAKEIKRAKEYQIKNKNKDMIKYISLKNNNLSSDVFGSSGKEMTESIGNKIKRVISTKGDLDIHITSLEEDLGSLEEKREEYTTSFENFDQKSTQLFAILSAVLKYMKESDSSIADNLL